VIVNKEKFQQVRDKLLKKFDQWYADVAPEDARPKLVNTMDRQPSESNTMDRQPSESQGLTDSQKEITLG
jgi:hypothetical protein